MIPELLEKSKADPENLEDLLELILFFGTASLVDEHKQKVLGEAKLLLEANTHISDSHRVVRRCARYIFQTNVRGNFIELRQGPEIFCGLTRALLPCYCGARGNHKPASTQIERDR